MLDLNLSFNFSDFKFASPFKNIFKKKKRRNDLQMNQDSNLVCKDLEKLEEDRYINKNSCFYLVHRSHFITCWYDNLIREKYDYENFIKTNTLKDLLPKNKYLFFKNMIKKAFETGYVKETYHCNITGNVYAIHFTKLGNYVLVISFPLEEDDME